MSKQEMSFQKSIEISKIKPKGKKPAVRKMLAFDDDDDIEETKKVIESDNTFNEEIPLNVSLNKRVLLEDSDSLSNLDDLNSDNTFNKENPLNVSLNKCVLLEDSDSLSNLDDLNSDNESSFEEKCPKTISKKVNDDTELKNLDEIPKLIKFNEDHIKQYYHIDPAINQAKKDEYLFKFTNKRFLVAKDIKTFIKYVLSEKTKCFYEVIRGYHKLYADIDADKPDIDMVNIIKKLIIVLKKAFIHFKFPLFDPDKLKFSDSSTKGKLSIHLTYNDYNLIFPPFKKNEHSIQKPFWEWVAKKLEDKYGDEFIWTYNYKPNNDSKFEPKFELRNFIDLAVYTVNRAMRIPFSCKNLEEPNRVLKPFIFSDEDDEDNIQYISASEFTTSKMSQYLITCESSKIQNIVKKIREVPEFKSRKQYNDKDLYSIIEKLIPNVEIYQRKGNLISLKNKGIRICIIGGEENLSDNSYVIIRRDGLYYGCHDEGCVDHLEKIYDFKVNYDNPKEKMTIQEVNDYIPRQYDDLSHSDIFLKYNNDDIKICETGGCYIWNENVKLHQLKKNVSAIRYIQNFLKSHYNEKLSKCKYDKKNKDDIKLYNYCLAKINYVCSYLGGKNIFQDSLTELEDYDFEDKINKSARNLLPIKNNKVIDFKTLVVRDRTKKDLFSYECPVSFLGTNANFDNIKKFISDITCENESLQFYLHKLTGYFMTGETSGRGFYIFTGFGKNGKSVYIQILQNILGIFEKDVDQSLILRDRSYDRHRARPKPELHAIAKVRLATFTECQDDSEFNDSFLKQVTGGDTISARKLNENAFTKMKFCAKILIATNKKPKFDIGDMAMLDRIKYIPFRARFTTTGIKNDDDNDDDIVIKKADDIFVNKLLTEYLDECFTYFAIGANMFYNEGLDDIDEIKNENSKSINGLSRIDEFQAALRG